MTTLSLPLGVIGSAKGFWFRKVFSEDALNYSLYDALVASGWDEQREVRATIEVQAGVSVGSESSSDPSMVIESLPEGSKVYLILDGRIQGTGGDGADVHMESPYAENAGEDGSDGGVALRARHAVSINTSSEGEIFGGGGGGCSAAAFMSSQAAVVMAASAGGGGAGHQPGSGGVATEEGSLGEDWSVCFVSGLDGSALNDGDTTGCPGTFTGSCAESSGVECVNEGGSGSNDIIAGAVGGGGGHPGEAAGWSNPQAYTNAGGSNEERLSVGNNGSAGAAIDGVSYVSTSGSFDIRGPQVN